MEQYIKRQETHILQGLYQYLQQVSTFRTLSTAEDQFRQAIETEITNRIQALINN